jgi:hypothetical protein
MPVVIAVGNTRGRLGSLVYNPNVVHFKDDFENSDNWDITGSYDLTQDGLRLYGNATAITKSSVIDGKDNFVVVIPVKVNAIGDFTVCAFTDENGNPTVELRFDSSNYRDELYVEGEKVWEWSDDPSRWEYPVTVHKIGSKLFLWGLQDVNLPSGIAIKKLMLATHGADVTFRVGVYESAGFGTGFIRPVWTSRGILKLGNQLCFVANRFYQPYNTATEIRLPSVLTTSDMVTFEQRKHIWLSDTHLATVQYAYSDGQNVYVWLRTENGFRVMVLNFDFDVVAMLDVTVSELPEGTELFSIYFVNTRGRWYGVGSLSDGSVAVFTCEDPRSPSLTFAKFVYTFETPRSIVAHAVTDLSNDYVLVVGGHEYIVLDPDLESVVTSGNLFYAADDVEVVLKMDKWLYKTEIPPKWW